MEQVVDIYNKAIQMTSGLLRRNRISEDAEHYVNEAYLLLAEAGKEITAESLYGKSRELALGEASKNRGLTKETMKVCPRCKVEYPISFFGMAWVKKLGRKAVNGWCKKCRCECAKAYRQKNKANIAAYQKIYHKLNYKKENVRNKKRIARKNLYYSYVKAKLKQRGFSNEEITMELVEEARQRILARRAKVKKSRTRILASVVNNHC